MIVDFNLLKDTATVIVSLGIGIGIGVSRILPLRRKQTSVIRSTQPLLKISSRTGGAVHISEESLSKLNELNRTLEEKYLSIAMHNAICAKEKSEMKLYISGVMEDHTTRIIQAIDKHG